MHRSYKELTIKNATPEDAWQSSVDYELTEEQFVSWIVGEKDNVI